MVGWNIEIMFMFAIAGIIYYNTLSDSTREKILGIPERWFWAVAYSAFCVLVEVLLNLGGHLVWEYPWWNRSVQGVVLIFLFGYFHFYVPCIVTLSLKTMRAKTIFVGVLHAIAIVANVIALGHLGWVY